MVLCFWSTWHFVIQEKKTKKDFQDTSEYVSDQIIYGIDENSRQPELFGIIDDEGNAHLLDFDQLLDQFVEQNEDQDIVNTRHGVFVL